MINSDEPKDGDFITYVENLVRLPPGARMHGDGLSPGEVGRGKPQKRDRPVATPHADRSGADASGWGHGGSAPARNRGLDGSLASAEAAARAVIRSVARLVAGVGAFVMFIGIALLALSFMDDAPFVVEPSLGLAMLVIGAVLNRIARRVT